MSNDNYTSLSRPDPAGHTLRLHHFLPQSRANGPGKRAVIWVQGCALKCPGCFNGSTHPRAGGKLVSVDSLVERIAGLKGLIEGITVSGGEPLQQREGIANLLRRIRASTSLSILLFTGFSWPELEKIGSKENSSSKWPLTLLDDVDVLIAGRYDQNLHLGRDLRGSANKKTYFLTERYTEADIKAVPGSEAVITGRGEILLSGIAPLSFTAPDLDLPL